MVKRPLGSNIGVALVIFGTGLLVTEWIWMPGNSTTSIPTAALGVITLAVGLVVIGLLLATAEWWDEHADRGALIKAVDALAGTNPPTPGAIHSAFLGARYAQQAPSSWHCIRCGSPLAEGSRFCARCGTPAAAPPQ
jgi:hypothetical protein